MQANQEVFGTFPGHIVLYALLAAVLALFFWRTRRLYQLVRLGRGEDRLDHLRRRAVSTLGLVVSQWGSLKDVSLSDRAGIGHFVMFWTGLLFLVNYAYVLVWGLWHDDSSLTAMNNGFSRVYDPLLDVFASLCAAAVIWALVRRYMVRPKRLETGIEAGVILVAILFLMITHYAGEAFRIALAPEGAGGPVSAALSRSLSGLSTGALTAGVRVIFWLHMGIVLGFLVYIPFSKHLHILVAPLNLFLRSSRPQGSLPWLDVEKADVLGAEKIEDFTWKHLLDLYACAKCGRCSDACPAHLTGQPLSPKDMIENLKVHLLKQGSGSKAEGGVIGRAVTEEEIWACTTCGACQAVCPVCNEHVDDIVEMRRNLVMVQDRFPETIGRALKTLMTRGDPYAGAGFLRTDWLEGLGIKPMAEQGGADILLWAGCTAAMDERGMKVLVSMARLLTRAGIGFGVLGDEEACCGDPARRIGHEVIFQMQARQNIDTFRRYNVRKIVTCCPHCFNTMRNEYPHLGGDFQVAHHTELIADLVREGRLKLSEATPKRLTYHDACYLGRYNGIYRPPREVIRGIPGAHLVEMGRSREKSFCCGAGGGRAWVEQTTGRNIYEERAGEAVRTGAEAVVTACPFCLEMLTQGVGRVNGHRPVEIVDLAELVERSLPEPAGCCQDAPCAAVAAIPGSRSAGPGGKYLQAQGGHITKGGCKTC